MDFLGNFLVKRLLVAYFPARHQIQTQIGRGLDSCSERGAKLKVRNSRGPFLAQDKHHTEVAFYLLEWHGIADVAFRRSSE
jgi:hypothetical protein